MRAYALGCLFRNMTMLFPEDEKVPIRRVEPGLLAKASCKDRNGSQVAPQLQVDSGHQRIRSHVNGHGPASLLLTTPRATAILAMRRCFRKVGSCSDASAAVRRSP